MLVLFESLVTIEKFLIELRCELCHLLFQNSDLFAELIMGEVLFLLGFVQIAVLLGCLFLQVFFYVSYLIHCLGF
jgi:hypothetical protein